MNIDIFRALRNGDNSRKNFLKRAWGHILQQKVESEDSESTNLTKELLITFEHLFLTLIGRIVDSDLGESVKTKSRGTSVPMLERAKSVIDTNTSENLLGSAFEVLFKEFDRYITVMAMFQGIDWTTYVNVRNKERKDGASPEEFFDEKLLDEEQQDEDHKKRKEERKKAREEEKAKKEAEEEKAKEAEESKDETKDTTADASAESVAEESKAAEPEASQTKSMTDAEEEKKDGAEEEEKKDGD